MKVNIHDRLNSHRHYCHSDYSTVKVYLGGFLCDPWDFYMFLNLTWSLTISILSNIILNLKMVEIHIFWGRNSESEHSLPVGILRHNFLLSEFIVSTQSSSLSIHIDKCIITCCLNIICNGYKSSNICRLCNQQS